MFKELLILSLTATVCLGIGIGACKDPKTPTDFDLQKFAGTWYEVESTSAIGNLARKCSAYKFEFKGKNKASLLHKFHSKVLGKSKSEYFDVSVSKSAEPARLSIQALKSDSIMDVKKPMWIVDTDYDSYALVYSCQKKIVSYVEHVHVLSRTKTIDDKKRMDLYDILKKKELSQKGLNDVPQQDKECKEE